MPEKKRDLFDFQAYQQGLFDKNLAFDLLADQLWDFQTATNLIMKDFVDRLQWESKVSMPIEFFKACEMKTGTFEAEAVFESSGTTGQQPSKHFVKDLSLYEKNVIHGFKAAFPFQPYQIFALLPSYLERQHSSLVHMVKVWMREFGLEGSGFFLYNFREMRKAIEEAQSSHKPILIIGVSFALLDFVEEKAIQLPPDSLVIETGGMKGRKKEMLRSELHQILKEGLGIAHIHSEYGMTEMMSQAYTREDGRFVPAPTLKVWTSDFHLQKLRSPYGKNGRLHLIDLANVHSCGFIATDDIGRVYEDGSFEVMGRIDTAEMRGCNLMYV